MPHQHFITTAAIGLLKIAGDKSRLKKTCTSGPPDTVRCAGPFIDLSGWQGLHTGMLGYFYLFFFFNLESLFQCIWIFLGFVAAAREEGEEWNVLSWLGLVVQNCVLVHFPSGQGWSVSQMAELSPVSCRGVPSQRVILPYRSFPRCLPQLC